MEFNVSSFLPIVSKPPPFGGTSSSTSTSPPPPPAPSGDCKKSIGKKVGICSMEEAKLRAEVVVVEVVVPAAVADEEEEKSC